MKVVVYLLLLLLAGTVFAEWTNELTMTSSMPAAGGQYGRSLHTFGDFAIVGENYDGGRASIYMMPDEEWVEQARLERVPGDLGSFGFSVSLEASIAAVGSPQTFQLGLELNYTDAALNSSAHVHMYGRNLNTWTRSARLTSMQPGADAFGYSVALGGPYLIVGAPYAVGLRTGDGDGFGVQMYDEHGNVVSSTSVGPSAPSSTQRTGAVYSYQKVNDVWIATGTIVPFMADEGDLFGWSVDISADGTRLVVGSPGDRADGSQGGSAYIFFMDTATGTWSLETRLTASDEEPFDGFGYSVGVDVSDIIIGTKTARAAYIFHKLSDSWTQDAKLVGSDTQLNDGFGQSVSIFSTYAIVGAPQNMGKGAAYLWELDMKLGSWESLRKLSASLPNSHMGSCVSIGSRFLLVGAPAANHDIGQVLTMTLQSDANTAPVADSLEDVLVLIRFSGSSSSIDLLVTRKILADAAGTGTAQTEVRIVDLGPTQGPVANHLFGLQVRFTSSSSISAGAAAHSLIAALPDIRYRLNAAVGAVSGTAEIIEAAAPVAAESTITIQQVAAVIILVLVVIFTTAVMVYFSLERRKVIAADQREFDQMEAEREAKKQEALKRDKNEKKPKQKRPGALLRGQKRKDRSYMQAENDAAGLEFGDTTMFEDHDFPGSPRMGGYDDPGTARLDYDPTESIDVSRVVSAGAEDDPTGVLVDSGAFNIDADDASNDNEHGEDGPRISLHLDRNNTPPPHHLLSVDITDSGPKIVLEESHKHHKEEDGPKISLDVGHHDDGPKLGFASLAQPTSSMNDGPKFSLDDSPALKLEDGPRLNFSDGPVLLSEHTSSSSSNDGPSLISPSDGPSLSMNVTQPPIHDGPSILAPTDGPSLGNSFAQSSPSDGPSLSFDLTPSSSAPISTAETPSNANISGVPTPQLSTPPPYDSGSESDSGVSTPTKLRRPTNVPRLNLSMGK